MDPENRRPFSLSDVLEHSRLNRRQLIKRSVALGVSAPALSALLAACAEDTDDAAETDETDDAETDETDDETEDDEPSGDDEDSDAEEDDEPAEESDDEESADQPDDDERYGGTLTVAISSELSTFDPHQTTATVIGYVVWQMLEHLFTWDEDFNTIPELAESQETSDDGLTNTITLREGVPFHNGDEMTAEDVIACMERWGQLAGRGQVLFEDIQGITQVDDYTVEVQMSQPNGVFWTLLSRHNNGCCIYPKEVIDDVGLDPVPSDQIVGTGPYQFVDYQPDDFIHVERFEDYAINGDEPNGWGGAKYAYVDEIFFRPVTDDAARTAGLLAGDYHILQLISPDNFETLEDDPNAVAELLPPASMLTIQLNTQEGLMSDPLLRQAIRTALDHEPILQAAYGSNDIFRMEPSLMMEELGIWYTEACSEYYNQNDPDQAAELLDESEYNGEALRFITSEYQDYHINTALTAQQQLEAALGLNIEVEVYDWPTLSGEVRQDMSRWELLTSGTSIRPDPSMISPMDPQWGARWDTERKRELLDQLMTETDQEARAGIWEDIQCLAFEEDVPMIYLGKALELAAYSPQVQGYRADLNIVSPFFWNLWLDE